MTSATSQRPPLLSELSRRLCLLRFVLKELIQTEKDYVKDLGIVVEVGNHVVGFLFPTNRRWRESDVTERWASEWS